jgi:hypothetical protein
VDGIVSIDRWSQAPLSHRRAVSITWSQVGLNRLAWCFIVANVVFLVIDAVSFWWLGLSVGWSGSQTLRVLALLAMCALWAYFCFVPGSSGDCLFAEITFVTFLILLFTNIGAPAQYAAVAAGAPFRDSWLAAADRGLGIDLPALVAWTHAHPMVSAGLTLTYHSFAPQLIFTVLVLGVLRERERLWEFAFHFYFCLIVAIAVFAIIPAACAPAHLGFVPTIDMTRAIAQIQGFHDGSLSVVAMNDLDGLISFPSFHVAGALIFTWAFRHRPRICVPVLLLNVATIASTFMSGEHYVVDVLAALPLFALSDAVYRRWGQRLLLAGRSASRPRDHQLTVRYVSSAS